MQAICKKIGQRIREIRKNIGLSQEQLAEKADISVPHISRIETGISNPQLTTLYLLAEALQVPMTELFRKDLNKLNINKKEFIKKCNKLLDNKKTIEQVMKSLLELENLFQ